MGANQDILYKKAGFDEIMDAQSVTTSDSATNTGALMGDRCAQRLFVGVAGNVVLVLESNNAGNDAAGTGQLTLLNVAAGVWHKIPPTKRIKGTGTTATNIVIGVLFDQ